MFVHPWRRPVPLRRLVPGLLGLVGALAGSPAGAQTFVRITTGSFNTDIANSTGASWVDYDGDGDADLFVCNQSAAPNYLYRNDGGGSFPRVSVGLPTAVVSIGSSWADYDNDGDLDACLAGPLVYLARNEGGTFTNQSAQLAAPGTLSAWGCAWADYDNDGFVDLLLTYPKDYLPPPNASNAMFHNNGDGTFTRITTGPPVSGLAPYTVPTWADHDDDGDADLFIGSGPADGTRARDYLYRNRLVEDGAASFETIGTAPIATDLVDGQVWNWIDMDNDGDLDAFLTNWWGGVNGGLPDNLYRHESNGSFTRVTSGALVANVGFSLSQVWEDFDNDGDLDVFVTNAAAGQPNRYYRNNGDGTFTRSFPAVTSDLGISWAAAASDYDGDGDVDLFVGNAINPGVPGGPDFLYRNDTVNGNRWLSLKLAGTTSNAAAIGAKARVKTVLGGVSKWQRRDVTAQDTFCGQNDLTLHFGLGSAAAVESLTVEWPSGLMDTMTAVPVDTCLVVEEGSTGPVPVTLHALAAERTAEGVAVTWTAAADVSDQARFFVNRGRDGIDRSRVSPGGFEGAGTFRFVDRGAPPEAADYWIEELSRSGAVRWHGPVRVAAVGVPGPNALAAAPNPFRHATRLDFLVTRPGRVTLQVFDAGGRPVADLLDRDLGPGTLSVSWDATDSRGRRVPPGVYLVRCTTPEGSATRKLLRLGANE